MIGRWTGLTLGLVAVVACSSAPETETAGSTEHGASAGSAPVVAQAGIPCEPVARMPLEGRASPYDSTMVTLGGAEAKVCYGRPSMRGRTIFGDLIPYGQLWRTGANEPTIIHLPFAASIAGIAVEPGSYSLYTIPGQSEWTVIVNRSTSQWGIESQYTPEVQAQEVARATVPAQRTSAPVETFQIRAEPQGDSAANLVLEWENTRVAIPLERRG